MDALMASLQEILKLSNEQLTTFTADFETRLPKYLRNALHLEVEWHKSAIFLAEILNFQGTSPISGMGSLS